MTDDIRAAGGPLGPPWSVDLLADLHAGALDPRQAEAIRRSVHSDPQAVEVLRALDNLRADLAALSRAPVAPMPAHFAAKLDAALDAEARRGVAATTMPVIDLDQARRRKNRRLAWGTGLLTAAAAAVAVTFAVSGPSDKTGGVAAPSTASSGQGSDQGPLTLSSGNLGDATGKVASRKDYGSLGSQERLDQCIKANGYDPTVAQTVGVRPVMLDGRSGVLALLTTGEVGRFRLLVVSPDCGPGNPGKLADTTVGGVQTTR